MHRISLTRAMLIWMPRLFLIDSFGYIFRAYHARARTGAPPMRTSKGVSTEAVFIFHNMVKKLIGSHKPDYLAAIFESTGPTFREQDFAAYKANRTETPPDLLDQIPLVRRLLEAMKIPVLEFPSFEADDVIGGLAKKYAANGFDVVIVSSDKDLLQLVTDKVSMLNPAKDDMMYGPEQVKEFMGVAPSQVADLLALKGDAVDNIPGAPGIGEKGAKDIILRFGSVEAALEHAAEVEKKTYRESLQNNREQMLLSKKLATVDCSDNVDCALEDLQLTPPDAVALRDFYREMEFFTFLKDLEKTAPQPARVVEYGTFATYEELREFAGAGPVAAAVEGSSLGIAKDGKALGGPQELAEALFNDAGITKIVHNSKDVYRNFEHAAGIERDIELEAFLLNADPGGCRLDKLSETHFSEQHLPGAAAKADLIWKLAEKLGPRVAEEGGKIAYEQIDLPVAPVLAKMERTGIRVDTEALAGLSGQMEAEITRLTSEIYELAGHPFNINSPPQLGKVLFEEMGLPVQGKTGKTKNYSTAADVLELLAAEHPVAAKVLEFRAASKLKSTYVDALPTMIRPATGRVHTTFNQTGAATGRLSSSDPNLQNIPIRTALGREIRAAFVPEPGWVMISADYSQIELRLLAHLSGDQVLVEAFQNGEDIHTRTAAEVFGAGLMFVTPEMRRSAKAVNFGIVYGQTAFGLSQTLGIPRGEAQMYIKNYFERYSGVKKWIDETIAKVRELGYSTTMHGRRRPIPDIQSRNPNARGFAERTAVNTPLQGSASDLIKLAMIRLDLELAQEKMHARVLLQVHDELLLEAPADEAKPAAELVKRVMEEVAKLKVPLLVEAGVGPNWRDAK